MDWANQRGTAEQRIKEGKQAAHWTRLSCHRFRANEGRLQPSVLAYNLGNLWRRLVRVSIRFGRSKAFPVDSTPGRATALGPLYGS